MTPQNPLYKRPPREADRKSEKEVYMAFYKKTQLKSNEKWYPRSITVGKPATTKELSEKLAEISTVSPSDTYAVLLGLASGMKAFMKEGRSVKLEGIGTFYYTADASGNGVDTPEEVSAKQIKGVRVRFLPETTRTASGKVGSRVLVDDNVQWLDISTLDPSLRGSGSDADEDGGDEGEDTSPTP